MRHVVKAKAPGRVILLTIECHSNVDDHVGGIGRGDTLQSIRALDEGIGGEYNSTWAAIVSKSNTVFTSAPQAASKNDQRGTSVRGSRGWSEVFERWHLTQR